MSTFPSKKDFIAESTDRSQAPGLWGRVCESRSVTRWCSKSCGRPTPCQPRGDIAARPTDGQNGMTLPKKTPPCGYWGLPRRSSVTASRGTQAGHQGRLSFGWREGKEGRRGQGEPGDAGSPALRSAPVPPGLAFAACSASTGLSCPLLLSLRPMRSPQTQNLTGRWGRPGRPWPCRRPCVSGPSHR